MPKKREIFNRVWFRLLKPWFRYISPPRVLNFRWDMNAEVLRGLGATVSDKNVRLLSPITIHRGDLKTEFSNLTIGDNVVLNGNNYLDVSAPVTLENGVSLGPGVIIISHNWFNGNKFLEERLSHTCGYKDVLIKEGAGIKAGAVIVMGVTIGRNAVVGAQALVNRDVPDNCFVAGVPSKVVKDLSEDYKNWS